ncbi:hypothetical protein OC846_005221 [Tilletia horrida]|uniref:Endonuclease V n=1 Tax=Tilletia horrida TaxID=155126 RepID=A0AAN6GNS0_9BASI|nr:hypothetical protein OC845_005407 [Tilletia horrida]KAK0546527.1 hypothetical protein OC846_005221 [Tilletia horrida]KAK0562306.1 hypothetical protein OC861_005385 [Tilletia horrida]
MTIVNRSIADLRAASVHPSLTPERAREIQATVASRVIIPSNPESWPFTISSVLRIAALDISYPVDHASPGSVPTTDTYACLALAEIAWPLPASPAPATSLKCLKTLVHRFPPASFPYIPGLLAFRELGPLLNLIDQLETPPDLLLCDGQGIAHPEKCGLASHLGVLTGIPSVGSAKSWFAGYPQDQPVLEIDASKGEENAAVEPSSAEEAEKRRHRRRPSFSTLPTARGARLTLYDSDKPDSTSNAVGHVLRSQTGINPIFVSPGHKIGIEQATDLVLALCTQYRLPDPIRWADHASREALRVHPCDPHK